VITARRPEPLTSTFNARETSVGLRNSSKT